MTLEPPLLFLRLRVCLFYYSFCSTDTSSYNSECQDDEEIALAMQAAEIASRQGMRARFKDSHDLVHRLFVCISGNFLSVLLLVVEYVLCSVNNKLISNLVYLLQNSKIITLQILWNLGVVKMIIFEFEQRYLQTIYAIMSISGHVKFIF